MALCALPSATGPVPLPSVPPQVSSRTASLLVTLAVRAGVDRAALPLSTAEMREPFLAWDRYLELMEAVEAQVKGPEPFIALCARFGEIMPDLRGLFSLPRLTDAAALLASRVLCHVGALGRH